MDTNTENTGLSSTEEILEHCISGLHQYILEEPVHLVFASGNLCDMTGYEPEELISGTEDLYAHLVHAADIEIYAGMLRRLLQGEQTASAQYRIVTKGGSVKYISDTAVARHLADGRLSAWSVLADITPVNEGKTRERERYLKALSEVYDKIFEYDFAGRTAKCLYGHSSGVFRWLNNVPVQMEEAAEQWIQSTVLPEDRAKMHRFFNDFYRQRLWEAEGPPPQIGYRAVSADGSIKECSGIFLKLDGAVCLFCSRNRESEGKTQRLHSENASLRSLNENMQKIVMQFTDGIVAFEVREGQVRPLYVSDNVCDFFGFTRQEWAEMAQSGKSIESFISRSGVAYENFMGLLEQGQAEFSYTDVETGQPRSVMAVCSQKYDGGLTPLYVMLYNVNRNIPQAKDGEEKVYIRTFGYFDVFVDGKPIVFRNKKSKELFALLVDRRGGFVSSEEAVSYLWEDEAASPVILARYRKVALRLKNILEEYGIAEVMESVDGKRRIVTERVRCDLYDYLSREEEYARLFKGSYLTNYSWGETTLGELLISKGGDLI